MCTFCEEAGLTGPTTEELEIPEEPEIDDEPIPDLAPDLVPTVDDAKPVATYRDWVPGDTEIVTYTVGNTIYKGIPAESRDAARAHCEATRGRVLEANYVQGRAFFRVAKAKSKTETEVIK